MPGDKRRPDEDGSQNEDSNKKHETSANPDKTGQGEDQRIEDPLLRSFMDSIKVSHTVPKFIAANVKYDDLANLKDSHLEIIGIIEDERQKILAAINSLIRRAKDPDLVTLLSSNISDQADRDLIKSWINGSIHRHKFGIGGKYRRVNISEIISIDNPMQRRCYDAVRDVIKMENNGEANEVFALHGSPTCDAIARDGFDIRLSKGGHFGKGIYVTLIASKAAQYAFKDKSKTCTRHGSKSCYECQRELIVTRVILGNSKKLIDEHDFSHAPPNYHSVTAVPVDGLIAHQEYVLYDQHQCLPVWWVKFKLIDPKKDEAEAQL